MSTFEPQTIACPRCNVVAEQRVAVSINAARRPAFRDEVIAGSFHRFQCAACNSSYLYETTFTYLDFERGQFLFVCPSASSSNWRSACEAAKTLFTRNLSGPDAPPAANALGARMTVRVCFGLDAFREKVLCAANEVDDALLEVWKLRACARAPLAHAATVVLRLDEVTPDELRLSWRDASADGVQLARLGLAAPLDSASEALKSQLLELPWVDAQRLLAV